MGVDLVSVLWGVASIQHGRALSRLPSRVFKK
jgi:hypothetical protein